MNRVSGIAFTESLYSAQREWKTFAASDGSFTEQTITHVGAGLEANAIAGDEHQRRSFPDNGGLWASAGYEFVRGMDLEGNAARIASEAVELLQRPAAPRGHAHDPAATRASSTCRSTRAAATRPSSTAPSAPRPATPARAS